MSTLGTTAMTLADIARGLDPNGEPARIIELLTQNNEILRDILFLEGNLPTGHRTTVRTGLPTITARLLNQGTIPGKSTKAQIDEQVALFDAFSEIDVEIANLGGNPGAVRLSEARAYMEAMNQKLATTLFYGSALTPQEFIGLGARYNDSTAGNGDNVIKAGGSGSDNTSIYLVAWDEETVCGIYPKGSVAGLQHEDLGIETANNAGGVTGALLRVYRDHWMWKCGIALKDWRYCVRIANIDLSDLAGGSGSNPQLIDLMEQAEETLPNELGTRVFYMNRRVRRFLRKQTRGDVRTGGQLSYEVVDGRPATMFGTTPVRITDALVNTETLAA